MSNTEQFSTWLEIEAAAIADNVRQMRRINRGRHIMAMVKANGYGHGLAASAQAALQGGAAWFGVARLEEALALRQAGIAAPVVVLGHTPPGQAALAIAQAISMTVWTPGQVEHIAGLAQRAGGEARLHIKVETGMNRIGALPEQAATLARQVSSTPGLLLEGMFTHFARSDEADLSFTHTQVQRFQGALAALERDGVRPPFVHAANSAAGLAQIPEGCNLLRMGIALYGLQPSLERRLPEGFRPALRWKAVLSHVKTLVAGEGISYNHEYVTTKTERIGTIPVGYADGFRRKRPNEVLVGGVRAPVVGRVCMDQCMLSLEAVPGAQPGDEVVIIGEQGEEAIRAEDVAARWGTNNYDVVSGIAARVTRVYW